MNLSPTYLMLSLCWIHCIKESGQYRFNLLAFSKSAWEYFQMLHFLAFKGGAFRVRVNPL